MALQEQLCISTNIHYIWLFGYLVVYDSYVGQRHIGSINVAHMAKYGITLFIHVFSHVGLENIIMGCKETQIKSKSVLGWGIS